MRCLSRDTAWGNAELLRATRDHPGRILGYVALWPADPDEVRAETETYLGAGFVGLKLHNCNGFPYDHPAYDPAYERANARQMPALYHSWGGDKELEEIRKVSNRFPNLSLLLAHAGAANEENYARIARECPNVYLELALSRSPRGLVKRLVDAVGADRVVWGSDMYFLDQAQQIGKVAGAQISEEDKIKILSGNAQRILGRIV
jgi:predicted TIM-barrel fold metal-dependent hydrolase